MIILVWSGAGRPLRVDLTEVEQEFEGVVSDREIVGVSPIRLGAILTVLCFYRSSQSSDPMFPSVSKVHNSFFELSSNASVVPSHGCEGSPCSKYWSVKVFLSENGFVAFQTLAHRV